MKENKIQNDYVHYFDVDRLAARFSLSFSDLGALSLPAKEHDFLFPFLT